MRAEATNSTEHKSHCPAPRKTASKRKTLITLGVILVVIISAAALFYWWQQHSIKPVILDTHEQRKLNHKIETVQKRTYQAGTKIITLTEREINALFHHNTAMGDKVRFELANNAIHARIRADLDQETPIIGGHTLHAKARFIIASKANRPALILDDLTVWGISVPNTWLGELKGQNLLTHIGLDMSNSRLASGIQEISVNHGEINIILTE